MDEGTHKFWPMQVKENSPTPSEAPQVATLPLKPKPAATPAPAPVSQTAIVRPPTIVSPPVPPPAGTRMAYCNNNNVVLRDGPGLTARKVGGITRGQRMYVMNLSSNYDTWRGITANWAYVQLENSPARGWVFTYFISY
jgi:hypothetical protein